MPWRIEGLQETKAAKLHCQILLFTIICPLLITKHYLLIASFINFNGDWRRYSWHLRYFAIFNKIKLRFWSLWSQAFKIFHELPQMIQINYFLNLWNWLRENLLQNEMSKSVLWYINPWCLLRLMRKPLLIE